MTTESNTVNTKYNKPHKHAEVIKAWADGAEIEYSADGDYWGSISDPSWIPEFEYRVKPEVVVQTIKICTPLMKGVSFQGMAPEIGLTITKDPSTGNILDLQWKQLR